MNTYKYYLFVVQECFYIKAILMQNVLPCVLFKIIVILSISYVYCYVMYRLHIGSNS